MSWFFFSPSSNSDSESSSEEEQQSGPVKKITFRSILEEKEEVKREVRSAKVKRYEELKNLIKVIRNAKKINDYACVYTTFEGLTLTYQKTLPVIVKEEKGITPRFYIKILVQLDDYVNELWMDKNGRKNMSKRNAKFVNLLRSKLRKYLKVFEKEIDVYRKSRPDEEDSSDSDEEDSGAADPSIICSEEEEGSGSDSGSTSSGSPVPDWKGAPASIPSLFLKTAETKSQPTVLVKEKPKPRPEERKFTVVEAKKDKRKSKLFDQGDEITIRLAVQKLYGILAARGRKSARPTEQVELLNELLNVLQPHNLGPAIDLKIRLALIEATFDTTQNVPGAMKPKHWTGVLNCILQALDMLQSNQDIQVTEEIIEEQFDQPPYQIKGCLLAVVERVDEEFFKLLKECDPHCNEYILRLKDEIMITQIIDKLQTYIEHHKKPAEICGIYSRKIEHMYYKPDATVFEKKEGKLPEDTQTSVDVMDHLCNFVCKYDDTNRLRTRAILCRIYHHALHDNWSKARDLMLMSHLQESIQHSDPMTQILFNRTIAQLGLCAFRNANIKDSHNCLADLMVTGKYKELLAQGPQRQRFESSNKEQEKIERQLQLPFHMHINLVVLECVYLVSAMLIDIPYLAEHEFDIRRRMISKMFYLQLRSSERQNLLGPPESMREHIVAASKAMRNGDWNACLDFIINDKMNTRVWNNFNQADKIRSMLKRLIQEESLRTYLFTFSSAYDSISIGRLSQMFEMETPAVHSVISKMIINEELKASFDEDSKSVVMGCSKQSRLQLIALQLVDKVDSLVESNERIHEEIKRPAWHLNKKR